jgi:exosortase/archaeosortase family protein
MSLASISTGGFGPRQVFGRVQELGRKHRLILPAIALVLVALCAYGYTLSTMFDYLALDTPLAYLPLLPLFSLGIAVLTVRRYRKVGQPSRDRHLDLLIAIPILAVAVALITIVPALASTYYWTDRADVLSLAFFVVGSVILLYGTTWFWRLRASLLFLFLMWPALYLHVLNGVMDWFTSATNAALSQIVQHVGALGVTASSGEGNLLITPTHGSPLLINVGTACSGANSVLGFTLIGGAILVTMQRARARKLLWLLVGVVLCFSLNVVRLVSILALARSGHPELALGGYHAVIGLVLFTVATAIMMRLLPVFRLQPRELVTDGPVSRPVERLTSRRRRVISIGLLAALASLVAAADFQLSQYAAFADGSGVARVAAFPSPDLPSSLHASFSADYPWAKQYFGDNSTFDRYIVSNQANGVVYADVVRTDNRGALDAYNLQNCFLFHDYNITRSDRVDLGGGVTGVLLNYSDPATKARWSTISWAWPVRFKNATYYERIALTSNLYGGSDQAPDVRPSDGLRGIFLDMVNTITGGDKSDAKLDAVYRKADVNLQSVAQAMVQGTVKHSG